MGDNIGFFHGNNNFVGKNNTVGGSMMNNVTISGDGTVIGDNNNVITTVHKGLSNGSLKELGESLALLRGEIIQTEKIVQKDKKQATNAIEDVEEEVSDKNPNPNRIVKRLQDFKEIMETSG